MGTALSCSSCNTCSPHEIWRERQFTQRNIINTEVQNPRWAAVCNNGNLNGVKNLHIMHPDIIDAPVDEEGHTAIHIAVINADRNLFDYILKNGNNINALGGGKQNTALHEAVLLKHEPAFQIHAIRSLFAFGIDDQMINLNGYKARDLCPSSIRREFQRAKRCRMKLAVEAGVKRTLHKPNPLLLDGMETATSSSPPSTCGPSKIWGITTKVTPQTVINTTVRNHEWADACNNSDFVSVQSLHMMDPEIIDDPVDEEGHTAIHIAVINKDPKLLEYVLKHGINVNAVGGMDQNTALHEAVLLDDDSDDHEFQMNAFKSLFLYQIDDQILNVNGHKAMEICPSSIRRQLQRAKLCTNQHIEEYWMKMAKKTNAIKTSKKRRSTFVGGKREEINDRQHVMTAFGKEVGCELDEIAFTIHQMTKKKKIAIWKKFFNDQQSVYRLADINRLMTSMTRKALESRTNRNSKKPPQHQMRLLTEKIGDRLPKEHGKRRTLSKSMFVDGNHEEPPESHPETLYSLLYRLYAETAKEERPSLLMTHYGESLASLLSEGVEETNDSESMPFIHFIGA